MNTTTDRTGSTLIWFGFVIFLSSACLLILEIVASRLLAPYVGVSLYTWTAIIGVILAGLSMGNWLGGIWADRGAGLTSVGWTLIAGGLLTLAIPYLLVHLANYLQSINISLLGASLAYVCFLFFLPALVLGIITPMLTTMALQRDKRTGHIVGAMHALAALGSICGTFAAGFWLIPWLGTRAIILGTGIGLGILGLFFLLGRPKAAVASFLLVSAAVAGIVYSNSMRTPCDRESHYYCIRIIEEDSVFGTARTMVLDHMVHSINHRDDSQLMITSYTHAMDEMLRTRFGTARSQKLRVFFAGGGAYTQPRALKARYPGSHVEVAEIDPDVTAIARDHMYVDMNGIEVHDMDARMRLPELEKSSFDAIVTDVFHDIAIPYHLTTIQFAALVRSRLKPDGLYLLNIVDQFPDSQLVKGLIKSLSTQFENLQVWLEEPPAETARLTYVLSATNGPAFEPQVVAEYGVPRVWFDLSEPIQKTGTPMRSIPLLTDDHAPVEKLVSSMFWGDLGK